MLQTFNVPAGGRIVNAKASFFRYESANAGGADESLRVRADGNDLGTYLPGDAITLPVDAKNWEITPVTPTATSVVRLGVGGIESSRIFGNVRVIDDGRSRTLSDQAFLAYVSQTAGAAVLPVVQLLNPVGSGKLVTVKAIRVSTPTAGNIAIGRYGTAMPAGPYDPQNKRFAGATSNAKLYRDTPAALPGVVIESMSVGSGLVVPLVLQEPVILAAGEGITVGHSTVQTTILATFEFVESAT